MASGELRLNCKKADIIPESQYDILWVTNLPFEYDEKRIDVENTILHPMDEDMEILDTEPQMLG